MTTRVERLARALWNQQRWEYANDDGGTMPAFHAYADGKQEPMPWQKQEADLHAYFRARARRLLRAMQ
jgi:hypothetical protein